MLSVMIIILLITYACYELAAVSVGEHRAAASAADLLHLELCADSAEELVQVLLSQSHSPSADSLNQQRPEPEELFANVAVGGHPSATRQARFTILGERLEEDGTRRLQYGPADESAKLSLRAVAQWERERTGYGIAALAALPGMDASLASEIVAFLLGTPVGAEASAPPPAAQLRGRDKASSVWQGVVLDELGAVDGVTPHLLWGGDRNANLLVSPWESEWATYSSENARAGSSENARAGSPAFDSGSLATTDASWGALLTVYSAERNVNRYGEPRIYVNDPNLDALATRLAAKLPSAWAEFIMAYRSYGPTSGGPTAASNAIISLYDLIGAQVSVPASGGGTQVLESPWVADRGAYRDFLLQLSDELTTDPRTTIPGRININLAPRAVLKALPGTDDQLVDRIVAARDRQMSDLENSRYHASWLAAEGWVELAWLRELEPYITTGGHVHRAQIVSFFAPGEAAEVTALPRPERRFLRREITIDAAGPHPRIVVRRDLTNLGPGFAREVLAP
jgi:type II secretory pathway component PulK